MKLLKSASIMLTALILSSSFIGCGNNKPSDAVENYFSDIKDSDSEFQNLIKSAVDKADTQNGGNEQIPKETYEKLVNKIKQMKYTVNSENIDGDNATINLTVTGVDLTKVFENVIKEAFSEIFNKALSGKQMTQEETNAFIFNLFNKYIDEAETTERTGDITLNKVDGKWKINQDSDFAKLILGIDEEAIKNSMNSGSFNGNLNKQ